MKKMLVANDLKPLMLNAMNFLQRSEIRILTAHTNDEILKQHITENANLIITKHDTPGLAVETLVHTIRRGERMRHVSIMLTCGNDPEEQRRCTQCGANAVVTAPVNTELFARKVQELLDVAPRRHYRVVLNASMEGRHNNRPFICSSMNVSAKGMLLRTAELFGPGDEIACSFYLPDGKRISASGEVVRIVRENSGSDANQYGIRFTTLPEDHQAALAAFVDREMRRAAAPGLQPAMVA